MEPIERDLIKERLTQDEVLALVSQAGGLDQVLSKRSPAYKKRADHVTSEPEWIAAMVEEPRLIRRPILVTDHGVGVGFDPGVWSRLLA